MEGQLPLRDLGWARWPHLGNFGTGHRASGPRRNPPAASMTRLWDRVRILEHLEQHLQDSERRKVRLGIQCCWESKIRQMFFIVLSMEIEDDNPVVVM